MNNPWEEIALSDYENHMRQNSVYQLQTLNAMMKEQFEAYPACTVMLLGAAGGNGLEHVDPQVTKSIYCVDINENYLRVCEKRYPALQGKLKPICMDLTGEVSALPQAELLVADLLIEYIGYPCFQNVLRQVDPKHVSCVIQSEADTADSFVSDSPYLHAFDRLDAVHHTIQAETLGDSLAQIGYRNTLQAERALPNGKKLIRLDFIR